MRKVALIIDVGKLDTSGEYITETREIEIDFGKEVDVKSEELRMSLSKKVVDKGFVYRIKGFKTFKELR